MRASFNFPLQKLRYQQRNASFWPRFAAGGRRLPVSLMLIKAATVFHKMPGQIATMFLWRQPLLDDGKSKVKD